MINTTVPQNRVTFVQYKKQNNNLAVLMPNTKENQIFLYYCIYNKAQFPCTFKSSLQYMLPVFPGHGILKARGEA